MNSLHDAQAGPETRQHAAGQQQQQRQRAPPPPGALPGSFSFNVMQHFGEMPAEQETAHHAAAAVGAFEDLMRRHMQRMQAGAGGPSIVIGNRQGGVMLQISTGGAAIPINIGM